MYLEMAMEDDKKMAEGWKSDADGILIFVCLYLSLVSRTNSPAIDWFILRFCCCINRCVYTGHSTELTGYLQFLPPKYL